MPNLFSRRSFFTHFMLALMLVVGVILALFYSLLWFTGHGQVQKVPNVVGKPITEAIRMIESSGLKTSIQATVFVDSINRSSIISQMPGAGAEVKADRIIFLTVNRAEAPLIDMPELRGFSVSSAQQLLRTFGFRSGSISYVHDLAKDAVKDQLFKGNPIQSGTKLAMGSSIDLVLGDGLGNERFPVPDIVGMPLGEARAYLKSMKSAIGNLTSEDGITEPEQTIISKQDPTPTTLSADGTESKNYISPGQPISVWISK